MRKKTAGIGCALAGVTLAASVAGVAGLSGVAKADAPAVTAGLGGSRSLPAGYFGINYDYGGASVYEGDSDVAKQLAALGPGTVRWPAGTGADYFQWQKGYPVDPDASKGKCGNPQEGQTDGLSFTLEDLAAAYRSTHATPIFDLNVMTASLSNQLDMLRTAHDQYGLPVRYVELGNEFYLCTADFVKKFPTAEDYGKLVAADVAALHRAFPGVRVAAVGALPDTTARSKGWNAGLLSEAKPDAVTLHDHPEFNESLTASELPSLFAEAFSSAGTVASRTSELHGIPAWITEYGLSLKSSKGNPPQLTYANALFEGASAVQLAQKVHDATLINYWSAFGPSVSYAYTSHGLSPAGLATQWLDQAAGGAKSEAPVTFTGGPVLGSTGYPALVGESFRTGGTLLINLSGQRVTVGGKAIGSGGRYEQVTGNPVKQYSTASDLTVSHGPVARTITLAPYSMTVITGGAR